MGLIERWMTRDGGEWTGWSDCLHRVKVMVVMWWHWRVAEPVGRRIRPPCPGCGCRPVSRRYDRRLGHERQCPLGPRAQGLHVG